MKKNKAKENRKRFIKRLIKHNRICQVMLIKEKGQSSLWKGDISGNVIGLFDCADKLIEAIDILKEEETKYESAIYGQELTSQWL